jgi:DNA-binding GntR family transcriptional regulator
MTSQVFTPVHLLELERAASAVEQHRTIAKTIIDGDGDAAEARAREHIRTTIEHIARREEG